MRASTVRSFVSRLPAVLGRSATAILQPYPALQIAVEGSSDSAANDAAGRQACRVHPPDVGRSRTGARPLHRPRSWESRDRWSSNSTAAGREQNRRVEIVISGDPIGTLPFWDRTYNLTQSR